MVLNVGPPDFSLMLTDWGRTIQRRARTATGTDALGHPTYTLGSADDVTAIVQDVRTDDRRVIAGILEVGDKTVYVAGTTTIAATDELTIDGERYRVLEDESPAYGDTPTRPYRAYLVRKVAG